jgi:hypothetical protein
MKPQAVKVIPMETLQRMLLAMRSCLLLAWVI